MNNILYHASIVEVKQPLTHVGIKDLDFGPGFYLTNSREQAERWANTVASRKQGAKAIVNEYFFNEDAFLSSQYERKIFNEYSIEWLDFIVASRKGQDPWKNYDWIEGGIANDSVITTVDAYLDGIMPAEIALGRLIKEELRHQVCISNQSIIDKYLSYVKSEEL